MKGPIRIRPGKKKFRSDWIRNQSIPFLYIQPIIILAGEGWPVVLVGSATGKELNLFLYRWERGGVEGEGGGVVGGKLLRETGGGGEL